MEFTLFYAWQSDTPSDDNHYLIRDAAKDAVKLIAADNDVEESPRLDHDTAGLSGTPAIADSIFAKIESCGMFLADVTFVGSCSTADGRQKKLINPNVAIELGFAGKAVGWERVILVMNTAYGGPEDQAFDIKHRRNPIAYNLPAGSDSSARKEARKKLAAVLEGAIKAHLRCEHEAVKQAVSVLDQPCLGAMVTFGQHPYFSSPVPQNMGQALTFQSVLHALSRLLELRLLRCDVQYDANTSTGNYAYHWTYLGVLALKHLGIRKKDA